MPVLSLSRITIRSGVGAENRRNLLQELVWLSKKKMTYFFAMEYVDWLTISSSSL